MEKRSYSSRETDRFQQDLNNIIYKKINPEEIDYYAKEALEKLIGLIDLTQQTYLNNPLYRDATFQSDKEKEDQILQHFNLGSVGLILDHIFKIEQEIKSIDQVIDNASDTDSMILPNDNHSIIIENKTSNQPKIKVFPKTKTTLFVLLKNFSIDFNDQQQFKIEKGNNHPNSFRKSSYYMITLPNLQRTIFVCDEDKNATYIINNLKAEEIKLTDLKDLTKIELGNLLQKYPELGKKINYYQNSFIDNLIKYLNEPLSIIEQPKTSNQNYLNPITDETEKFLSRNQIAEQYNISLTTVIKIINELNFSQSETNLRRVSGVTTKIFNQNQIDQIVQKAIQRGIFLPQKPENTFTIKDITNEVGELSYSIVAKIAKETTTEPTQYKNKNRIGRFYTETQKEEIIKTINQKVLQLVSEDHYTTFQIAREFQVDRESVKKIINQYPDIIGQGVLCRSTNGKNTLSFSQEQKVLIGNLLEENEYLLETVPDDFATNRSLAKELKVGINTVIKIVNEYIDEIGPVGRYKASGNPCDCYSPEQQLIIRKLIQDR